MVRELRHALHGAHAARGQGDGPRARQAGTVLVRARGNGATRGPLGRGGDEVRVARTRALGEARRARRGVGRVRARGRDEHGGRGAPQPARLAGASDGGPCAGRLHPAAGSAGAARTRAKRNAAHGDECGGPRGAGEGRRRVRGPRGERQAVPARAPSVGVAHRADGPQHVVEPRGRERAQACERLLQGRVLRPRRAPARGAALQRAARVLRRPPRSSRRRCSTATPFSSRRQGSWSREARTRATSGCASRKRARRRRRTRQRGWTRGTRSGGTRTRTGKVAR